MNFKSLTKILKGLRKERFPLLITSKILLGVQGRKKQRGSDGGVGTEDRIRWVTRDSASRIGSLGLERQRFTGGWIHVWRFQDVERPKRRPLLFSSRNR